MSHRKRPEHMTDKQLVQELGRVLDTTLLVIAYELEWRRES